MYEELIRDDESYRKTSNELIFVTEPVEVSQAELKHRLDLLLDLVRLDVKDECIREVLFLCISSKPLQFYGKMPQPMAVIS